jgi:hypothetical protein
MARDRRPGKLDRELDRFERQGREALDADGLIALGISLRGHEDGGALLRSLLTWFSERPCELRLEMLSWLLQGLWKPVLRHGVPADDQLEQFMACRRGIATDLTVEYAYLSTLVTALRSGPMDSVTRQKAWSQVCSGLEALRSTPPGRLLAQAAAGLGESIPHRPSGR